MRRKGWVYRVTLAALQNYSQNALSQQYQTRLQDLFQGAQLGANLSERVDLREHVQRFQSGKL